MTTQVRNTVVKPLHPINSDIKQLIPDMLPTGHVSLNLKRIRFIKGQGVVLYDDTYAVEIYVPRGGESPAFFGVHRHHGKIQELNSYFLKPMVMHIDDHRTTSIMKEQFEEAVFQFLPLSIDSNGWVIPTKVSDQHEAKEIVLHSNLSGAA